jgi:HK97 family phage major capsid protein
MDPKALREQRAKLIADARAIAEKAAAETRGLSPEEVASQRKMLDDAKLLTEQIRNAEELEAEERALAASLPESQRTGETRRERTQADKDAYNTAFRHYLQYGFGRMTADEQRTLQSGYREFSAEELRDQSTLSGAVGGFDVRPDTSFYGRIVEAQKAFSGMLTAGCTILTTGTGATLPIPTADDTANEGVLVAEEQSHAGGTNVTLAQKSLGAYLYSSKFVKVSWQLLQDSETDWEGFLARIFGMRLGRIGNKHLTIGTGTNQPQGVVTGATVGRQSVTGNATSVPFDDFTRLIHSVDVAYRTGAKFMMNDLTALELQLLKDGNGRPLWQESPNAGQPATIKGYATVINNHMPTMEASAKHTAFGAWENYFIRQVRGIQVVRLNELYAANGQVGFLAFMRMDGGLVDAGQAPIKVLQNSAA